MKKIKILTVVGVVIILLFLNVSITNSNGKVEEMYLSSEPELALAEGQCWMRLDGSACICDRIVGPACVALCISSGQGCTEIIIKET